MFPAGTRRPRRESVLPDGKPPYRQARLAAAGETEGMGGMIVQEKVYEETVKWVGDRPLTFAEFLEMFGPKDLVELIDGAVVEKSMVQLDHEKLVHWLDRVIGLSVEARQLGIVLGSRTAVEIH
jgi:hypothetical protein